jgi:hypothetical protein
MGTGNDQRRNSRIRNYRIGRERPLGHYTRALSSAGFVIEDLREPHPSAEVIAGWPRLAPAVRRPWSLLIRARLT